MADFTDVGNTLVINMSDRGETVAGAISGTYVQTILFQIEQGSPNSGSWMTIDTFNTVDGTEAFNYVTKTYGETLRFLLSADTSGTAAVTLTDTSDLVKKTITDGRGNLLAEFKQSGLKLYGGLQRTGAGYIVALTAATLTLSPALHAGRIVVTNRAATLTITLPPATGTGNVYTIYTALVSTPADHIYQAAGSDVFNGTVGVSTDIAGVMESAQLTDSTITLNGTTAGGLAGSVVHFVDVASAVWWVSGAVVSSGSESTIFS